VAVLAESREFVDVIYEGLIALSPAPIHSGVHLPVEFA